VVLKWEIDLCLNKVAMNCFIVRIVLCGYKMAQVSRQKLDEDVWKKVWQGLVDVVEKMGKGGNGQLFLSRFLTETEKVMLAKRMMILVLTELGWSAYKIAKELKMGTATVYRYQMLLERDVMLKKVLDKLIDRRVQNEVEGESVLGRIIEKMFVGYRNRSVMTRV